MPKRISESPDHWSDIMGLPDEWDKQNLSALINNFYKEKFTFEGNTFTGRQWAKNEIEDARKQHRENDAFNEGLVKIQSSDMRAKTAIPNILWSRISEAYPTMFKDRKHLEWFTKNFPQFRIQR